MYRYTPRKEGKGGRGYHPEPATMCPNDSSVDVLEVRSYTNGHRQRNDNDHCRISLRVAGYIHNPPRHPMKTKTATEGGRNDPRTRDVGSLSTDNHDTLVVVLVLHYVLLSISYTIHLPKKK